MGTAAALDTKQPPAKPSAPWTTSALIGGAVGAALILAGLAIATYVLPTFWKASITPALTGLGSFLDTILRLTAQLAVVGGFVFLGSLLLSGTPAKGTRGAIGMILAFVIAIFFIGRAVGMNLETWQYGLPVTVVAVGGMLGGAFRYLNGSHARHWMISLEEQGWFSLFNYKKTQGLKARRYTLIGFLLIGLSGVYSLISHGMLTGDWVIRIPFTETNITLLTDLGFTAPILLSAATFWISWRAVNMPDFADFLIATEAEMNKVSWSSRKRLIQDTIVVLVFVVLVTLFLMVVDLFWGWLLSNRFIQVLPSRKDETEQVGTAGDAGGPGW